MDLFSSPLFFSLLEIIWIDILLSGDNAVLIAMACRSLPGDKQRLGIGLGAATAVALRILFATVVTFLLAVPYLKVIGGLMLVWIAVKLVQPEKDGGNHVKSPASLFGAVRIIALTDMVMSLDNVVAVAGVAKGNVPLFAIGLLVSIPIVVVGASITTRLIQRFPVLVWFSGALLGWVAGEMVVSDPFVAEKIHSLGDLIQYGAAAGGALTVVVVGLILSRFSPSGGNAEAA